MSTHHRYSEHSARAGFIRVIAVTILGLIVIGIGAGAGVYVAMNSGADDESSQGTVPGGQAERNTANDRSSERSAVGVVITLKRSNISMPSGGIDVMWRDEMEYRQAKPLDLFSAFEITNHTDTTVRLTTINNEQSRFLGDKKTGHGTPMYILPKTFYGDNGAEYSCRDRELFTAEAGERKADKPVVGQRNVCNFAEPITVKPNTSVTLESGLFATRDMFTEPPIRFLAHDKELASSTYMHYAADPSRDERYWLLSNVYTDDIGGFIVGDAGDAELLRSIFAFQESPKISTRVEEHDLKIASLYPFQDLVQYKEHKGQGMEKAVVEYQTYKNDTSLPTELGGYHPRYLRTQVMLYRNGLLTKSDITGTYTRETKQALQKIQRRAGISPTGRIDAGLVKLSAQMEDIDNGYAIWEAYGHDVVVGYNAKHGFTYLGSGIMGAGYKPARDEIRGVTGIVRNAGKDGVASNITLERNNNEVAEKFIEGKIVFVNTGTDVVSCTVQDMDGASDFEVRLKSNEIFAIDDVTYNDSMNLTQVTCNETRLKLEDF